MAPVQPLVKWMRIRTGAGHWTSGHRDGRPLSTRGRLRGFRPNKGASSTEENRGSNPRLLPWDDPPSLSVDSWRNSNTIVPMRLSWMDEFDMKDSSVAKCTEHY